VPIMLSNPVPAAGPNYTVTSADGTATAASGDYNALVPNPTTAAFPTGVYNFNRAITVNGDSNIEGNETMTVGLTTAAPPGNPPVVTRTPGTVTIMNDDDIQLSVGDAGVIEGTGGSTNLVFTVFLNSKTSKNVTFNYATADGTALAGSD